MGLPSEKDLELHNQGKWHVSFPPKSQEGGARHLGLLPDQNLAQGILTSTLLMFGAE